MSRIVSKTIDLSNQTPYDEISKYITNISQNGISIHPKNNDNDKIEITDHIEIIKQGVPIASYGETSIIGDQQGFHIKIGANNNEGRLSFYQGPDNEVAYITNNQLYITQSVVLQQMDLGAKINDNGLGQWSWKVHANGQNPSKNNLNLKWMG